jgi:sugar lactone lactonase YvrE
MSLERRLRRALAEPIADVDVASFERDLHEVLQRGRRSRRNRRLVVLATTLAVIVGAVVLAPRALDALRNVEEPRPAGPTGPEGVPGVITTVAGTGEHASRGDGGLAVDADLRYPFNVAVDAAGNLYILENERVRQVDASGRITTVVGPPAHARDVEITEASGLLLGDFTNASGIDDDGNLYVGGGNGDHYMVNRVDPSGNVTHVAGTGQPGFSGDGGPATEAELGWVWDVVVDPAGNVYLAENDNNRIRMVDTNGVITTIAGTGAPGYSGDGGLATAAQLDHPAGIELDSSGNLYIADASNDAIRRVDTTGVITTVAGNGRRGYSGDGGPATEAQLTAPEHVAVDRNGVIYVLDTGNHMVRAIDVGGIITTIIGSPGPGFRGDGGPATEALLYEPSGMVLTPDGVLYIADSGNNRVRRVVL